MARRAKFRVGDVFLIKLDNDLKGVGRILKNYKSTVFVELYNMSPICQKTDYNFNFATQKDPALMIWCYDDCLKNGEWEIIDNVPVDNNVEMPYFWTQDAWDRKYYLVKGTDCSSGELTDITISEEEVHKNPPYGVAFPEGLHIFYVKKLQELNVL